MSANSGAHLVIGSVSVALPSSISIIIATDVIGLVIEAMRNSVSRCIGWPFSMLRWPWTVTWAISPWRQIRVTAPERSPPSMAPVRASGARARACWSKPRRVPVSPSMVFSVGGRANDNPESWPGLWRPRVKHGNKAHFQGEVIRGPMFDAVIFDCDGCLIDSEVLALEVEFEALAEVHPDWGAAARNFAAWR